MANEVSTQQNEVNALSNDINVITAEINAYQRVAGEAIFKIGELLKHVRDSKLAETKGGWNAWCENDLGMTRNHATRFIKVSERFGSVSPGIQNVGLTVLSLLTPFDDAELTQPHEMPDGSTKTLLEMSRREIEEHKRQLKKERDARERAERAAERALQMTEQERQRAQVEADKRKQAEQQLATATKPETVVVEREVERIVEVDKTDYKAVERLRAYSIETNRRTAIAAIRLFLVSLFR